MREITITCLEGRADPYAAAPALRFRLGIAADPAVTVHAALLTCQIRLDPRVRDYTQAEADLLLGVFGERSRWPVSMQQLQLATITVQVPGFTGETTIDVPVSCSYDLEVGLGKYLNALADGEIPLSFLFSGTVFTRSGGGIAVTRVPWDREAGYRLPVKVWRDMMDSYFPDSAWVRLTRSTADALLRYQARQALPTGDAALSALLAGQAVEAAA